MINEIYIGKEKIIKLFFTIELFLAVLPYVLNVVPSIYLIFLRLLRPFVIITIILCLYKKIFTDYFSIVWLLIILYMNVITYINSGIFESNATIQINLLAVLMSAFMCNYDCKYFTKILTYYFTLLIVLNTLFWRPGGTFVNANGQASFIIGTKTSITYYQIAALLFCYIYFKIEINKKKSAIMFTLLIISIIIYNFVQPISTSKICLVVFCLLILIDTFIPKLSRIILKYGYLAGLIMNLLIVVFQIQYLFEHLLVDVLHEDLTLDNRTFIWEEVIGHILNKPIWGHGTKTGITFINNINTSTHNQLLSWAFYYGIFGLVIMLVLSLYIIKKYSIYDVRGRIVRITYITFAAMWISEQFTQYSIYIIMTILLVHLNKFEMNDNKNIALKYFYFGDQKNGK